MRKNMFRKLAEALIEMSGPRLAGPVLAPVRTHPHRSANRSRAPYGVEGPDHGVTAVPVRAERPNA